jgi:hypothetical protein
MGIEKNGDDCRCPGVVVGNCRYILMGEDKRYGERSDIFLSFADLLEEELAARRTASGLTM